MSYQVLARKWRPKLFQEVVGQTHILRVLSHALDHQRLHHAWLFSGTRGVGKTTLARIFAKCLNCESGISATPCGTCSICQEIDQGRFTDLIEVDAASHTKVDETRALLENIHYTPTRGRYKVYLIDEVHMLSNHSFNALLKTLEEPPTHVCFLFATTDPQKLPVTILSRCLQLNLKRLSSQLIAKHLAYILEQEKIDYDPQALDRLAYAADGSMRDALSLLDQAIAFGQGQVILSETQAMLGLIPQDYLLDLLRAIAAQDGKALLDAIEQLATQGTIDFDQALSELVLLLHQCTLVKIVPNVQINTHHDNDSIQACAEQFSAEALQIYYQMALLGKRDLSLSPDPRLGFEMTLIRMLAFAPVNINTGIVQSGNNNAISPDNSTSQSIQSVQSTKETTHHQNQYQNYQNHQSQYQKDQHQNQHQSVSQISTDQTDETDETYQPESPLKVWYTVASQIPDKFGLARQLAIHTRYRMMKNNVFYLTLDKKNNVFKTKQAEDIIRDKLSEYLNRPIHVVIELIDESQQNTEKNNTIASGSDYATNIADQNNQTDQNNSFHDDNNQLTESDINQIVEEILAYNSKKDSKNSNPVTDNTNNHATSKNHKTQIENKNVGNSEKEMKQWQDGVKVYTVAEYLQLRKQKRAILIRERIGEDLYLQSIADTFGATVIERSIRFFSNVNHQIKKNNEPEDPFESFKSHQSD